MSHWHETVLGIIALGAIGSILGTLLLTVLKKPCAKLAFRFFSGLLYKYAENKFFVEKCEANNRPELIIIKYNATMQKFTRIQIVFVLLMAACFISWRVYYLSDQFLIFFPLIVTVMLVLDFYSFIVCYTAVIGCFPKEMKLIENEIRDRRNADHVAFIRDASSDEDKDP